MAPEMVDPKEVDLITCELRQMARDNSDVPSMLRMASTRLTAKDLGLRQVAMSACFTRAFHAMVNECIRCCGGLASAVILTMLG